MRGFAFYMNEELMMKNETSKTPFVDCTVRKRTLVITTIERTVVVVPDSRRCAPKLSHVDESLP